jgi:hypothetical protein
MKLGWASLARFGQPSKTLDSIKLDKAAYLQFVSPLLQLLPRKSSQLYLKKKNPRQTRDRRGVHKLALGLGSCFLPKTHNRKGKGTGCSGAQTAIPNLPSHGRPATVVHPALRPTPRCLCLQAAAHAHSFHQLGPDRRPRDTLTAYGPRFLEFAGSVSPNSVSDCQRTTLHKPRRQSRLDCIMPRHPSLRHSELTSSSITVSRYGNSQRALVKWH